MEGIKLVRIDFRLIHGQVITKWSNKISATRIVVVNDNTICFHSCLNLLIDKPYFIFSRKSFSNATSFTAGALSNFSFTLIP